MSDEKKPESDGPVVRVPGSRFRLPPKQKALWDATNALLVQAVAEHGPEMAVSVILSRLSRELRRMYGLNEAKTIFCKLAETMDEAAEYDREPPAARNYAADAQ